ncbi:NAD-dependent epimerase/dehydratase family protein [Photobacterium halotolerans]|uniref:NAD-dependent epimerase/dehydratase family protein n=1 Tax=Photobacterium halotolerans TaxID=265726 RepID=UPI00137263CA|nr:NAD-dependent epimerase/dehydratase family protein [Photobacterium halotolerans]NAX46898.1 NAD-dependent epimerase/dehydratase family protein [Photobacterium halotolerans]
MKKLKRVSVCGCGWLGLPLAKSLKQSGYETFGSKQTQEGAEVLEHQGIKGVVVRLPLPHEVHSPTLNAFLAADVMVLNVPPGRGTASAEEYSAKIISLSEAAKAAGCHKLIFISTTSVYGDAEGEITESTVPAPATESGRAHVDLEQQLRQSWGDDLVVLRLAGLIGPQRHPVKFLAGRQGIANGGAPVNLVHLDDVISAITAILERWPVMTTLHLSSPQHPSRAVYYREMARLAGLALPEFQPGGEQGKWINASATVEALGLNWRYEDLMTLAPEL